MTARGRAARLPSWSRRAQRDLEEIRHFIAADDVRAAERWLGRLVTAAERAAAHPLSGRMVPEFAREEVRELLVGNYRLVYRCRQEDVIVLTVFEGHRNLRRGPNEGL